MVADYLSAAGSLLLGVAAMGALIGGFSRFERAKLKIEKDSAALRKRENYRKLRFQVAVEAVDLFAKFQNDIIQIRSPAFFERETKELEKMPEENELVRNAKIHKDGGVILLRLDQRAETLAKINRLEPKFRILFDTSAPFEKVRAVRHKLWSAAYMRIEGERRSDITSVIYSGGQEDEVTQLTREAVSEIEAICRPVIREESD